MYIILVLFLRRGLTNTISILPKCIYGCSDSGNRDWYFYWTFWKYFCSFLKTKCAIFDPAITLINTYARKVRKYVHRKTYVWTLSALFIRSKKKKMETTKCPSTDEWIYKYGISYNEIISIIRKYWYSLQHEWTFKIIMLSKRVQSEKDTGYSIYIKFPEETNN